MDIRNRGALKNAAAQKLASADFDPRRLVLVHTLITVGVTILTLIIDKLLDNAIANYVGLSGLNTSATLSAIQSLVSFAPTLMALFWDAGYIYSMMHIAQGESTGYRDLPEGFRRWGKVLTYNLLWFLLIFGVSMGAAVVATTIFMMTPLSTPLMEMTTQGLENGTIAADGTILDESLTAAFTEASMPMMLLIVIVFAVLLLVMSYPFRLGLYALLDGKKGAFAAMGTSAQLMRGNKAALFKLDLSFWWYYLLTAAVSILAYLDQLLPMFGVSLPIGTEAAGYLAYGIYIVALLVLYLLARNRVETTYVLFYDALREKAAPISAPDPAPQPRNRPWNYG